ncbi:MAG: hypothetical protein ACREXY_02405, partial [Gammaproteobacteria bacterium]
IRTAAESGAGNHRDSHQTIFHTHVIYSYIHSNKVVNVRSNLVAPDWMKSECNATWVTTPFSFFVTLSPSSTRKVQ